MFLLGVVNGFIVNFITILLSLLVLFSCIEIEGKIRISYARFICLILVFIIGCSHSKSNDVSFSQMANLYQNKDYITIAGEIYKKEYKNDSLRIYLKDLISESGEKIYGNVMCFVDNDVIPIGSVVKVKGEIFEAKEKENEGEFDYPLYLKSQKIIFVITNDHSDVLIEPRILIKEKLYQYKNDIIRFFEGNLPGEESGLLASLCFGDKSSLDNEVKKLFQKAGISHIIAISGLHLSIIGLGLFNIFRKFGISILFSGLFSSIIVFLYGLLCQNPTSLIRASLMFYIFVISKIIGRSYDMLSALALSLICTLIYNPFYIFDFGYIMSFLSVLGIGVYANPIGTRYKDICRERFYCIYKQNKKFSLNAKERIIYSVLFGMSVQIFTAPIIAYSFNRIPVFVFILNLLLLPFMSVLLLCGLISGLFFFKYGLVPCHYIMYYYEWMSDFVSALKGSQLVIATPNIYVIFIYYCFLILLYIILLKLNCDFGTQKAISSFQKQVLRVNPRGFIKYKKLSNRACNLLFVYLIGIFLLIFVLEASKPIGFRIDMLSVGQGDGIYIQSKEGVSFFIDGGSTSKSNVGEYVIMPYLYSQGVGSIDYWFVTHTDLDHINGLTEALESGYRIDRLCFSKYVDKNDSFYELIELCKKNKTQVSFLNAGDSINTKSMKIEALFPNTNCFVGANENSLCLFLDYGDFQGIFTGDMGKEQEEYILSNNLIRFPDKKLELLKVAHHGSKNSSCESWLKALSPEVAIISAGKNNRYGHPNLETLDRLEDAESQIFCTIDCGRIRVGNKNGMAKVFCWNNSD